MLNGHFVALPSAFDGLLAAPAEAPQKSPHMVGMIADAEVPLGDLCDTPRGPHLARIAQLRRAGEQYSRELLALLGVEAYRATGNGLCLQPFFTLLLKRALPGIDRAAGAADFSGDPQRAVAGFQQLKGA